MADTTNMNTVTVTTPTKFEVFSTDAQSGESCDAASAALIAAEAILGTDLPSISVTEIDEDDPQRGPATWQLVRIDARLRRRARRLLEAAEAFWRDLRRQPPPHRQQ